jgi:cobalamin biosynthesis protein CbiM
MNVSVAVSVFFAAMLGDLGTYLVTSVQLALAFPAEIGGFVASFVKFARTGWCLALLFLGQSKILRIDPTRKT